MIQLISDVVIYGGFPTGKGQWNDRDPNTNHIILSGDLNGDDGTNFADNGHNSYHVVTADGTNETAILAGFIITAGNAIAALGAHSYGAGMCNKFSTGDFGVFELAWLTTQGQGRRNPVCDIAEPLNIINEMDLRAFAENWLQSAHIVVQLPLLG
jgi:hypothetical protein